LSMRYVGAVATDNAAVLMPDFALFVRLLTI
jgi:hypothetical protein